MIRGVLFWSHLFGVLSISCISIGITFKISWKCKGSQGPYPTSFAQLNSQFLFTRLLASQGDVRKSRLWWFPRPLPRYFGSSRGWFPDVSVDILTSWVVLFLRQASLCSLGWHWIQSFSCSCFLMRLQHALSYATSPWIEIIRTRSFAFFPCARIHKFINCSQQGNTDPKFLGVRSPKHTTNYHILMSQAEMFGGLSVGRNYEADFNNSPAGSHPGSLRKGKEPKEGWGAPCKNYSGQRWATSSCSNLRERMLERDQINLPLYFRFSLTEDKVCFLWPSLRSSTRRTSRRGLWPQKRYK